MARQSLLRPAQIYVAVGQIVAGGQQKVLILLTVDERKRSFKNLDCLGGASGIEMGDGAPYSGGGKELRLSQLAVEAHRLLVQLDGMVQAPSKNGQDCPLLEQAGSQSRIARPRDAMPLGGFQGQPTFLQLTPDAQAVAVLPPGPRPQVFQGCFTAGVRGEAGIRLPLRRLGEAQHLVEIDVALRMAGCEELLHPARSGFSEPR